MALISLPDDVKRIISALEKRGFEAYIVGGCVRDALLGRKPDDWDLTTSARPEEIKALFPRTIDTGIKHGTVTVLIGRNTYEVTTYRTDGIYEDGRHPTSVTFVPNLEEDLKRRDFTINAMAYNMILRRMIEAMKPLGVEVNQIIALGGGSKSDVWCQLKADATGVPVSVMSTTESSACLGAAILAGVSSGIWESPEKAADMIVKAKLTYTPDRDVKEIYDKLYEKTMKLQYGLKVFYDDKSFQ